MFPKGSKLSTHREQHVGKLYGNLLVTDVYNDHLYRLRAVCKCVCGATSTPVLRNIVLGIVRSCKCSQIKESENYDKYIGISSGSLVVLSFDKFNFYYYKKSKLNMKIPFVKCKCSCGETTSVNLNRIIRGSTKNCGCVNHRCIEPGLAMIKHIFSGYVKKAKARGLKFDLTIEQFLEFSKKNCAYCDKGPSNLAKGRNGDFVYNGIDRIDSSLGYFEGNMVACCNNCNRMKTSHSLEDFKSMIKRIYDHMKLGEQ